MKLHKQVLILLLSFLFLSSFLIAGYLKFPLNRKIEVTGYFGEYRGPSRDLQFAAHFHKGIDFSTGGVTGLDVMAPENGYIDYFELNHPLYGNILVLALPEVENPYTSKKGVKVLFCHLESIGAEGTLAGRKLRMIYEKIQGTYGEAYVKVKFDPEEITFRRGDVVAKSGDTGGVPPHLHVEVRDMDEVLIMNPGFFFDLGYERTEVKIMELKVGNKKYDLSEHPLVEIGKFSPIVLHTIIKLRHPINPKSIKLYIDDKLIYGIDFEYLKLEHYDAVNEIYVNSTPSDYWFNLKSNANLDIVVNYWDRIDLSDPKDALIVVEDHWGNKSEVTFKIVGR
ncbi:hypothetical protein [Kosmotoga sp.]|uniref:M23 family metallopeptidase n=1 Tax=Kosmotoga sp. TaxID=1955248 RepID=UPI0024ABF2F1|nr:hypothetical protein [Kosmotoga sp.]MDI3524116.1 hypothetical protein [Kosmotoga sp.]